MAIDITKIRNLPQTLVPPASGDYVVVEASAGGTKKSTIANLQFTSGNFVDGVISGDKINEDIAGAGLVKAGPNLAVNIDDVSLDIIGDVLQVKDQGITGSKIAEDTIPISKIKAAPGDLVKINPSQDDSVFLKDFTDGKTKLTSIEYLGAIITGSMAGVRGSVLPPSTNTSGLFILEVPYVGHGMYSWDGSQWTYLAGNFKGSTEYRPATPAAYTRYFDTTINAELYYKPTYNGWVTSAGSVGDIKHVMAASEQEALQFNPGWTVYASAKGRTIAGAYGNANGFTAHNPGDFNGEETHTLLEGELPAHWHKFYDVHYTEANGTLKVPGHSRLVVSNVWGSKSSDGDNCFIPHRASTISDTAGMKPFTDSGSTPDKDFNFWGGNASSHEAVWPLNTPCNNGSGRTFADPEPRGAAHNNIQPTLYHIVLRKVQ